MKRIACVLLTLALMGAFAFSEQTASVYETVAMSDTLETITESLGEGEAVDDFIKYGDALLVFYESGRLNAKGLYFDDVRDVAPMAQGNFALVRDFKQGTGLSEITALLGQGKEIMARTLADEDDAGLRKLYAWQDANGHVLEALVELDDGEWVLFALGEIE